MRGTKKPLEKPRKEHYLWVYSTNKRHYSNAFNLVGAIFSCNEVFETFSNCWFVGVQIIEILAIPGLLLKNDLIIFLTFLKDPDALMLDCYKFCLGFFLIWLHLNTFSFLSLLSRLFPAFVGSWLSFKTRIFCKVINVLCLLKKWEKQVSFQFDYFWWLWFQFTF